jgi:hypothetical protein
MAERQYSYHNLLLFTLTAAGIIDNSYFQQRYHSKVIGAIPQQTANIQPAGNPENTLNIKLG